MTTTKELIEGLSDEQVIEVTKELFNSVYTEVPYDEVISNSDGVTELGPLMALDAGDLKRDLSASESAHFGRLVLAEFATDPELETLVRQAVDNVQTSDDLVIGTILAVGMVVNLTLLIATTSVKVEKDADGKTTWKLVKKNANPELVTSVINPLAKVATGT
jgi:hypothetical protein